MAATQPILHVWTHRNYAYFMGGMAPNLVTLWLQRVGIGWLAWEMTHAPAWLGIVAAADLAPMLVLAPFAGVVTDRGNPLRQQRICVMLEILQAVALTVFTFVGLMTIELLFALSLLLGCVHPFASTSRHAIVPATVPREIFATAVALDSTMFNASRFVGPALAGLLIPLAGAGGTFAVNAFGCAIFLWALYQMRLDPPKRQGGRRTMWTDISQSLGYVRGHVGIAMLFMLLTVVSTLIRPLQDMLPGFSGQVFHSGAVGLAWLTSSMGVGAMISAGWIAARGHVKGLTRNVVLACLGLGLSVAGFVATDNLYVAVLFSALTGFTMNSMSTSVQTLVQSTVGDDMRGRVMAFYTLVYRGMPAIGALTIGALAEVLGLRWTFLIVAVLCLLAWLLVLGKRRSMIESLEGRPEP
ncbi:MAG TPA: MFS transporter [Alphaproteobacteria bacterium]|jgi:MFS family permease